MRQSRVREGKKIHNLGLTWKPRKLSYNLKIKKTHTQTTWHFNDARKVWASVSRVNTTVTLNK